MNTDKYTFIDGKIVNLATLTPIPDDEPVFILRAKDMATVHALGTYHAFCEVPEHREAVEALMKRFVDWRTANPHLTNVADTHAPGSRVTSVEFTNPQTGAKMAIAVPASTGNVYFDLWQRGFTFGFLPQANNTIELLVWPKWNVNARQFRSEEVRNEPAAVTAGVDKILRAAAGISG